MGAWEPDLVPEQSGQTLTLRLLETVGLCSIPPHHRPPCSSVLSEQWADGARAARHGYCASGASGGGRRRCHGQGGRWRGPHTRHLMSVTRAVDNICSNPFTRIGYYRIIILVSPCLPAHCPLPSTFRAYGLAPVSRFPYSSIRPTAFACLSSPLARPRRSQRPRLSPLLSIPSPPPSPSPSVHIFTNITLTIFNLPDQLSQRSRQRSST